MSDPGQKRPDGVSEDAAVFETGDDERWAIARARLEEHEHGAGTISVEEFMDELRRAVADRRAAKR